MSETPHQQSQRDAGIHTGHHSFTPRIPPDLSDLKDARLLSPERDATRDCPNCNGTGRDQLKEDVWACEVCEGTGMMAKDAPAGPQWSSTPPTEPGRYWFFGDLEYEPGGAHYHSHPPLQTALYQVEVVWSDSTTWTNPDESNRLIGSVGYYFDLHAPADSNWRKSHKRHARGYWLPATLPELPGDPENLFAAKPEPTPP